MKGRVRAGLAAVCSCSQVHVLDCPAMLCCCLTADFSVFVGDLAPDVTDFVLQEAFRVYYPSVRSAKVRVCRCEAAATVHSTCKHHAAASGTQWCYPCSTLLGVIAFSETIGLGLFKMLFGSQRIWLNGFFGYSSTRSTGSRVSSSTGS
jgi:hypothetical protein